MGAFKGLSKPVDEIETTNRVKPGAYEFQITDIKYLEFAADHATMGGQEAVVFELTIIGGDNESQFGKKFDSFNRYPNEEIQGEEKAEMFGSILKGSMLQFGIPESKLEDWDPENPDDVDAIIGLTGHGVIRINKKNKDFDNLYNFELDEESGASDISVENNVGAWK